MCASWWQCVQSVEFPVQRIGTFDAFFWQYYYFYTWVLLWWRCRTTAAGPPYNVSVTIRRLKNSHNICPQQFSGNTRHVRESIHRETLPKQHSFQFLTECDQSRRIPDMSRQRVPGSCCSRRESAVAQCCVVSTGPVDNRNEWAWLNTIRSRYWNAFHCYASRDL